MLIVFEVCCETSNVMLWVY